jgi:hypothetical protein
MVVQYWLSVKADRLIIILNSDPGYSGILTHGGIYKFTSYNYGGYDKFPVAVSQPANRSSSGTCWHQIQFTTYQQQLRQDGSESRDWQDGWIRSDVFHATNPGATTGSGATTDNVLFYSPGSAPTFTSQGSSTISNGIPGFFEAQDTISEGWRVAPYVSDKPNPITGKWKMYGFAIVDRYMSYPQFEFSNQDPSIRYPDQTMRGYMAADVDSPFLYLPGGLFAAGDELTDTVSGNKFFLVPSSTNTATGLLGNFSSASPGTAGVAILED